ncbi:MAG: phosphate/phosphite/phosphonate ABC transporter substrate-binding protein [Sulfuriferula sp.]
MNVTRHYFGCLLILLALPLAALAETHSITLGVFPNLPAQKIVTLYQPLAVYLTKQTGVPVRLASAKDFREFYQATRTQQFDFIVTGPNLAWLAMTEANYQPMARYSNPVAGVLLSKRNAKIETPLDCRNKKIAFTDPLSIVYQLGVVYLQSEGLQAGPDYQPIVLSNHTNAALAIVVGKADCAIVGNLPYSQMTDEIQHTLHIIGQTKGIASQFFMSAPKLDKAISSRIRTALLNYSQTPEGISFAAKQLHGPIVAANIQDLAPTKPYALITKTLLDKP